VADALSLPDVAAGDTGGLLALALDPDFERTRFVYALYTVASVPGSRSFRVARFREVRDTLADRVVVIDGVPASPGRPSGALRFGPDARLYAAFDDGGDPRSGGDLASWNGKVLRLNADATTPGDQPAMTPVYSYEHQSPGAFDWQATGTLWVADQLHDGGERLSAIPGGGRRPGGAFAGRVYRLPQAAGVSSLAFYDATLWPAFEGDLFAAARGGDYLLRCGFDEADPARVTRTERLFQGWFGAIQAVRVGPEGALYFATRRAIGRIGRGRP
jgi:glucose/arabinose dehydrogenase